MTQQLHLAAPDDSREFFGSLKAAANQHWRPVPLERSVYGYQVQAGTRWRDELSMEALAAFEREMGLVFPAPLRN